MQRMREKQTNRTGWAEAWWTYLSQVLKRGINPETVWGKRVSGRWMKPRGTSCLVRVVRREEAGGAGVRKVTHSR